MITAAWLIPLLADLIAEIGKGLAAQETPTQVIARVETRIAAAHTALAAAEASDEAEITSHVTATVPVATAVKRPPQGG